jgi:anti-sigma B factor antagonist
MTLARFAVTGPSGDQPALVTVAGDIDLANVAEFQQAMAAAVPKACNGSPQLTVDLTAVSYCDSAAVRALFSLAATTALTMVVKPNGHITTLLAISGLDRIATVVRRE